MLAAGCGAADGPRVGEVKIADFHYSPVRLEIQTGGSVTFTNLDNVSHDVSSDTGSALEFDTGRLRTDEGATLSFDEPGSYPYLCAFHPWMTGTVEVVE
jgi:plastocyanin